MTLTTQPHCTQMILPGWTAYGIRRKRIPKPRVTVGRFIHLGAGVQSSTVVEMMIEGEIAPVDAVLFADTGNEPPWVYGQVWYLAGRLDAAGIPLIVVHLTNSAGIVQDVYNANGKRFASMPVYTFNPKENSVGQLRRQCTSEYKIQPLKNHVLDWLMARGYAKLNKANQRRVSRKVAVESLFGISMDEFSRAKMNNPQWYKSRFPLLDRRMDRQGCIDWLAEHNLPVPKKSSCIICPYHQDDYWRDLQTNYAGIHEEACQFDDWLRTDDAREGFTRNMRQDVFLHRSCKPLRSIDFRIYDGVGDLPLFGPTCDSGHCFM